ncbi:RNA polymerase sigma factor [Bacteroidia bacterium]|nr:RNA polymerase sigma factor [Bacteroidia bacterium]
MLCYHGKFAEKHIIYRCQELILYTVVKKIMYNSNQLSEKQIIEMLIEGNHTAFTTLYNRYKNNVYFFIVKLSHGDYYMAEEIVQKTFIKIWEVKKNISSEHSIGKYIQVIAKNFYLKAISQRINDDLMLLNIAKKESGAENLVDDEVELKFLLEEIERIISLLPPAKQRVYRLKHIENLSQKDISEKLNISENTVETHLRQSNEFLRFKLSAFLHGSEALMLFILSYSLLK